MYWLRCPMWWREFGLDGIPFEAVKSMATAKEIYHPLWRYSTKLGTSSSENLEKVMEPAPF